MTWNGVSRGVMSEPKLKIPASILRASLGAIGRIACSSPAAMIASQSSAPRVPSRRLTSKPGTADQPVRLMTTGMSSMTKRPHQ